MKKNVNLGLMSLMLVLTTSACQDVKNAKDNQEEIVQTDYAAVVKENFPSIDEFINTVDVFQISVQQLGSFEETMQKGEKAIREMLEPKGFSVECGIGGQNTDFFSATRNCELVIKNEDFVYSYSIATNQSDSLTAAYYFKSMGDMYEVNPKVWTD